MSKFRLAPALDLRSLGLFRILFGALVLLDIAIRATSLRAHYSDEGVWSRLDLLSHGGVQRINVFLFAGSPVAVAVLFGVGVIAATAVMAGYRTKLAMVVTWVWMLSVQGRNEFVLNSGDVLFRVMAFWSLFLPLAERFSVDAWLKRRAEGARQAAEKTWVAGEATLAFAAQLVFLYLFAGILKWEQPAWRDGQGLAYAVWSLPYVSQIGTWMQLLPAPLLVLGNHFTLLLELPGAFAPLIPLRWGRLRFLFVAFFIGFHLVIELTFKVGLFSLVSAVSWVALLPTWAWQHAWGQRLERWIEGRFVPAAAHVMAKVRCREFAARPLLDEATERQGWRQAIYQTVPAPLILLTLLWNLAGMGAFGLRFPSELRSSWFAIGLDQRWEMFSRPIREAAWFGIPAKRADGTDVDLFSGEAAPRLTRPQLISADFPDDRWRKLFLAAEMTNRDALRMAMGRYFCRENSSSQLGARGVEAFLIVRFSQATDPFAGIQDPTVRQVTLWRHECFNGALAKWEGALNQQLVSSERALAAPEAKPPSGK